MEKVAPIPIGRDWLAFVDCGAGGIGPVAVALGASDSSDRNYGENER